MTRSSSKKKRSSAKGTHAVPAESSRGPREQVEPDTSRLVRLDWVLMAILLVLGVFQSARFYGHTQVPHPDFAPFPRLGHRIVSGEPINDYKRAPVLGTVQVLLGKVVGGQHPDMTAGRIINSLLHPLSLVLLFLVGRHLVGRWSFYVALLVAANPVTVDMLIHPIAETTLMFLILLTSWLVFRRSSWAYVPAGIATMVRYEGAALILAAFVIDMILRKGTRQRLLSLLWSALATLPLAVWMLLTALHWKQQGSTHYLNELGSQAGDRNMVLVYLELTWRTVFLPLWRPVSAWLLPPEPATGGWVVLSKIVAGLLIVWSLARAVWVRQWRVLAMLLFALPYLAIHVIHSFTYDRFIQPVLWIALLLAAYGIREAWGLLARLPKRAAQLVRTAVPAVAMLAALIWLSGMVAKLPALGEISQDAAYLWLAGAGAIGLAWIARGAMKLFQPTLPRLAVGLAVVGMLVCNQYALSLAIQNGQRDAEFADLARWFAQNTQPGEKLLTTQAGMLVVLVPGRAKDIVHINSIDANTTAEFVNACVARGIRYIAWDSRLGLFPGDRYYKQWGLERIAALELPHPTREGPVESAPNIGPLVFQKQILNPQAGRYINVYRLMDPNSLPRGG